MDKAETQSTELRRGFISPLALEPCKLDVRRYLPHVTPPAIAEVLPTHD
jgi:hypothetical protein